MFLSAKTQYACIAVLELAANYGSGQPLRVRDIAESHGIPSRFLVQILLQLKSRGIVGSTRGAAGGYQLLRDPADISLAEVMAIGESQDVDPVCCAGRETAVSRALLSTWKQVIEVQREMLESVTFAELLERARGKTANMYYI